ncbi:MAG: hypothetical protein ACKOA9_11970 [Actinomycetota bacterium]
MVHRRPRTWRLAAAAALTVLATGITPAALFVAQATSGSSVFATTAVYAPGALTAAPVGRDVALTWTAGRNGTGYRVSAGPSSTADACTGVTYTPLTSTAATAYIDAARFTPTGAWYCYRVETQLGGWTSVDANPVAAVQLGFVVSGVTLANGGFAGKLDVGDQITVRFNQPVSTGTGPVSTDTVCASPQGFIVLAAVATNGSCTAGEASRVGQLNAGSTSHNDRFSAAYSWSADARSLTITVTARVSGPNAEFTTGPWVLQPTTTAGALLAVNGGYHVCDTNSGGANCFPTATGSL